MKRAGLGVILGVTLALVPIAPVLARSGDLDPSFGSGGQALIMPEAPRTSYTDVKKIVVRPDGTIIALTTRIYDWDAPDSPFSERLVALSSDGSLDPGFGEGGRTDFPPDLRLRTLAVQPNNHLVLAGSNESEFIVGREDPLKTQDFMVLRLNPKGELDRDFGSDGTARIDFSLQEDAAHLVSLQPDGKVIAAGISWDCLAVGVCYSFFSMVRLTAQGLLDDSFGDHGRVMTKFVPYEHDFQSLIVAADGSIVLAGTVDFQGRNYVGLVRYTPNGSLDSEFGSASKLGPEGSIHKVVETSKGYVATADVRRSGDDPGGHLIRFDRRGALDRSFGEDGRLFASEFQGGFPSQLIRQPDGRLVTLVSRSYCGRESLVRFDEDGRPDRSFGEGGVGIDFHAASHGLALQPDGKFVTGGFSCPQTAGIQFVRFLGDEAPVGDGAPGSKAKQPPNALAEVIPANPGSLDSSFGSGGRVITEFGAGYASVSEISIQQDGKIVASGKAGSFPETMGALARYHPNGSLDSSFGVNGKVLTDDFGSGYGVEDMVIQPDGKIVVVGSVAPSRLLSGEDLDFLVARYDSDGTLDASFGSGGLATTTFGLDSTDLAFAVAMERDGKIIVAGRAGTGTLGIDRPDVDFALARYNPDGTLDPSFDSDGKVTTNFRSGYTDIARDVVVQPDGRIVVLGTSWARGSLVSEYFALARYNPDGSLDKTFDGDGKTSTDFGSTYSVVNGNGLALYPDSRIAVTGSIGHTPGEASAAAVARYNPNGSLDASFSSDGKFAIDFGPESSWASAAVVQGERKIVLVGGTTTRSTGGAYSSDIALARLNENGSLDVGFDDDGKTTTDFGRAEAAVGSAVALQPDSRIVVGGVVSRDAGGGFALARYIGSSSPSENIDTEKSLLARSDLARSDLARSDQENPSPTALLDAKKTVPGSLRSANPDAGEETIKHWAPIVAGLLIVPAIGVAGYLINRWRREAEVSMRD